MEPSEWRRWAAENRAPMFPGQRQRWLVLALGSDPESDVRDAFAELVGDGVFDVGDPGDAENISTKLVDEVDIPPRKRREQLDPIPMMAQSTVPPVHVLLEFNWSGGTSEPWLGWSDTFGPFDLTYRDATVLLDRVLEPTATLDAEESKAETVVKLGLGAVLAGYAVTTVAAVGLYWLADRFLRSEGR